MRPQRDYRSTSRETYKAFTKQHPDCKVSYKEFRDVIITYNNSIMDHLIDTGEMIQFPWGLGRLQIVKYRRNATRKKLNGSLYGAMINWPETKRQGKYVYYLNLHTSGFSYTFAWVPLFAHIKFKPIWRLEIWRVFKRKLSRKLVDPNFIYNDIYRETVKRRHFKQ